jgi:hypothetical protein
MAREEPEIGFDLKLGARQSFAVLPALVVDLGDTVKHEHGRQRQLWPFGE